MSKMNKSQYRRVWTAEAQYDPSFVFATHFAQMGHTAGWPAEKHFLGWYKNLPPFTVTIFKYIIGIIAS